jgi:hypothetical protein
MLVMGATANYSNLLVVGLGLVQVHHFQLIGYKAWDVVWGAMYYYRNEHIFIKWYWYY